ncbi:MAG: response regulator [Mangrovibacterium sp.]
MKKIKVLWIDDEVDLLRAHILFLAQKGYEVETSTNGHDAIEIIQNQYFDIVFLDENMPGLTGLETLSRIKQISPATPVVMITKSEEEDNMDLAIGSKIADYLIKPVHPKQILLTLKKIIIRDELVTRKTTSDYQMEFAKLGMRLNERLDHNEWKEIYTQLVDWELKLAESNDNGMDDVLKMQRGEANNNFAKFIKNNYIDWIQSDFDERPMLSHDLFKHYIFPKIDDSSRTVTLVIDNLRYDQYIILKNMLCQFYIPTDESLYYSILPTATQYARNAIFAGLMPGDIAKRYPQYWEEDDNEGQKNIHEEALLLEQLKRLKRTESVYYEKFGAANVSDKKYAEVLNNINNHDLTVLIFNFVDMISHARTEMQVLRELASDEKAYRSITESWFANSSLLRLLKDLAERGVKLIITTDHGSVRVNNPIKVIGDRETVTNLRYKMGRRLKYEEKQVFAIHHPEEAKLPGRNLSSSFIFALHDDFLAYPNNFNYYAQYYRDTFQHGGVSMEEIIVPIAYFTPKD